MVIKVKLTGHCNCGGVSYSFDGQPALTAVCHCKTCQRQTGSYASLVVGVQDPELKVLGETLGTFITQGDSGQPVQRSFCTRCGSPIVSRCDSIPGLAFIKAGTLDDTSELNPTAELYLDDAQAWTARLGVTCYAKGM
ncbi:GFA family protein [Pseudomonas sp. H11T01]|uniref:GFA family protein n=1 Tax=Pseudomonas sp. H11T01 TaxID=3402749 RepID=UPI003AC02B13